MQLSGYRRIYVDLPGMGESRADESIVDLESIYSKLVDFVDQNISRASFILVGTSLGGYIARALATQYASQILGLLLKVPMIEPDTSRRDLDVIKPIIEDRSSMKVIPTALIPLVGTVLVQTPSYIRMLLAKVASFEEAAVKLADRRVLDPIRSNPHRYSLNIIRSGKEATFQKPTLIITGRHDDVVGYRDSLRLLERYPRATFVALDRGIHALPVDEGDLVESLVRDWIRRVEEVSNKLNGVA